jgi:hypothetical protein
MTPIILGDKSRASEGLFIKCPVLRPDSFQRFCLKGGVSTFAPICLSAEQSQRQQLVRKDSASAGQIHKPGPHPGQAGNERLGLPHFSQSTDQEPSGSVDLRDVRAANGREMPQGKPSFVVILYGFVGDSNLDVYLARAGIINNLCYIVLERGQPAHRLRPDSHPPATGSVSLSSARTRPCLTR